MWTVLRLFCAKYEPTCIFCGDAKNVINYRGKNICPNCLKEMKKL